MEIREAINRLKEQVCDHSYCKNRRIKLEDKDLVQQVCEACGKVISEYEEELVR